MQTAELPPVLAMLQNNWKDYHLTWFSDFSLTDFSLSMFWYFLCKIHSVAMTSRTINYVLRVHFNSSSVTNDEFSSPFMEQWTLDAIGVLIISPTAGGGGLGRLRSSPPSPSPSPQVQRGDGSKTPWSQWNQPSDGMHEERRGEAGHVPQEGGGAPSSKGWKPGSACA